MTIQTQKKDMADMPVQYPLSPQGQAQERARFFNSGNAFNVKLPAVPARVFHEEAQRSLQPASPTGLIDCDQSGALECPFPATTPMMLARYARIRAGETLATGFAATASIWYVIRGTGLTLCADEQIPWNTGDVFLLPGGIATQHQAHAEDAVLWVVSNEPQLALDGLRPAHEAVARIETVHYPAGEISRQIGLIYEAAPNEVTSGIALIFSSARHEAGRNIMPSLTVSLNTLPPQTHQRAHQHNSAAITLALKSDRCYSMIGNERCAWSQWETMVTPPAAPHSHHNEGSGRAMFLIVQDGGLHYHGRTMGFSFLE